MNSNVLGSIASQKDFLSNHPFCESLKSGRTDHYSFVPKMTFFVMGFRDILEIIRVESPKSELDRQINHHCDEDSHHWLLFLEDLKTLNMDIEYWGGSIQSVLKTLWSDDSFCVRKLLYQVVTHIQSTTSSEEKLLVLECLEAAFAAFIMNMNILTRNNGDYIHLKYLGQQHFEEESDHDMGNWIEGDKTSEQEKSITVNIRERFMHYIVDDIFDGFNEVFTFWNANAHETQLHLNVNHR